MKKLIFLLLIPVMAAGQKQDTVWIGHGLYAIIGPSGRADTAWQIPNRSRMVVKDTIYRDSITGKMKWVNGAILLPGGQVDTSIYRGWLLDPKFRGSTTAHFTIDTAALLSPTWITIDTPVVRYDTARVIMFYSDTTNWCKETDCRIYNYGMFWQFGYRVIKMQGNWRIDYPDTYLDENKKRLPKNIIVWQTQ